MAAFLIVGGFPATASAELSKTQIGDIEHTGTSTDWNEFLGDGSANPLHIVGSGLLTTVRSWIGHSACPSCTPGTSKYQSLQLNDLVVGKQYVVAVHPSYITGLPSYSTTITSGSATIYFGEQHTFRQTGYFVAPEAWRIEFVASSTSVTLRIGNGLTSGYNYLYLDYYIVAPKTLQTPAANPTTRIGYNEPYTSAAWDEFTSTANTAIHIVGSGNMSTVRQWIGHSACGSCGPGTTKIQRLTFNNLTVGAIYWLTVYPAQHTGTATYTATVSSGSATINQGASYSPGVTGWLTPEHRWTIKFTPGSTSVSLDLKNGLTSGYHYLYLNWYEYFPDAVALSTLTPAAFSSLGQTYDTYNSGNWWKDDVENFGYFWNESYIMNSYVELYRQTLDAHWLEKLVQHADAVLTQRDSVTGVVDCYGESAPAWRETGNPPGSGYVWIGFTGAMFNPMMDFAALVLESPYLRTKTYPWLGSLTLRDKALEYVQKFQAAIDYHESEWVTSGTDGWYKFQNDIYTVCGVAGSQPLAGQPAAYDMNSLMMEAVLRLSDAYRAEGDARATTYSGRVASYARYFRSTWTYYASGDYYTWLFASYYSPNLDDIGHANFNIRFVTAAYLAGIEFTTQQIQRVANTYSRLILSDYAIPFNLMNATWSNVYGGGPYSSVYYWNTVAPYKSGLTTRAFGRSRLSLANLDSPGDALLYLTALSYHDYLANT